MQVIAIDGPAGSGKSTVARAVAERLGLDHLDTGAMYRAVACVALRRRVDPADGDLVAKIAREMQLEIGADGTVVADGQDATADIRGPEVTRAVSVVAANPAVREELVRRQRQWAADHGGGVIEGRDIGTVVFPEAAVKAYLTADPAVRAERRAGEAGGLDRDEVATDLARRDTHDETRQHSPMQRSGDAVEIDTTHLSIDEVVELVTGELP